MSDQVAKNREMIVKAQQEGLGSTLLAYTKLSGPGWLQSAITLGGGSLASALFLGILTGTNLLWVQLFAIIMGVIMLSAISHVTLSTGKKPFQAINQDINPVLGWGWLIATCLANMIWCMPQFSLSYDALSKNLAPTMFDGSDNGKYIVSVVLLTAAVFVLYLNNKQGRAAKAFDIILKVMVAIVVLSFFAAVMVMAIEGKVEWGAVFGGFIPDLSQLSKPVGELAILIDGLEKPLQEFWTQRVVEAQQNVIISAAATAVGINMTFLLPYSMLARGWDKPFRGMAKFDLSTGMVIPYLLVTTCVVIASATMFHAGGEGFDNSKLASFDIEVMKVSPSYEKVAPILSERLELKTPFNELEGQQLEAVELQIASMSIAEKKLASSVVKKNAFELSSSLAPVFGEGEEGQSWASLIFGIGVLGMGFSTIIILMLINGYAFCEMFNVEQGSRMHMIGCLVSGVCGAIWPFVWGGDAQFWLAIFVSSFGFILLPIAYSTFFMMMNNKRIMGEERPEGRSRVLWNVLMGISCVCVFTAVIFTILGKIQGKGGDYILGLVVVFVIAVIIGFIKKKPAPLAVETVATSEPADAADTAS
ncbi:MAG: hypothetical protein CMM03_15160 [Rhodopirellula sp.]|nr:hypothetical protein [Rhodopirellula sp.]